MASRSPLTVAPSSPSRASTRRRSAIAAKSAPCVRPTPTRARASATRAVHPSQGRQVGPEVVAPAGEEGRNGQDQPRSVARHRRKHIRKQVNGTADRPRLSVFRSARHTRRSSTTSPGRPSLPRHPLRGSRGTRAHGNRENSAAVGKLRLKHSPGVSTVTFDRNGYLFHGRVKSLADAAREAGLKF